MKQKALSVFLITPLVLLSGCSQNTSSSPGSQQLPSIAVNPIAAKPPSLPSPSPVAKKTVVATGPSPTLQREVNRYNSVVAQVQLLNERDKNAAKQSDEAGSKWVEEHPNLNDDTPYPAPIQQLCDQAMAINREQAKAMRKAAALHRRLLLIPSFRHYYVDGTLAIEQNDVPGDLLNTDAEHIHVVELRQ